jgi:hypothetical protein
VKETVGPSKVESKEQHSSPNQTKPNPKEMDGREEREQEGEEKKRGRREKAAAARNRGSEAGR